VSCKGTSAPGLALICAGTGPHLRRDWPSSAPGLALICAGTGPHLRRDRPTSAPGPTHICAGTVQVHVRCTLARAVGRARRENGLRLSGRVRMEPEMGASAKAVTDFSSAGRE
jgi:hypothetical protein